MLGRRNKQLPEQSARRLRDFLYLDADRARGLLAQLEGGVVEQIVDQSKRSSGGRAGASVFGVLDLGGNLLSEKASEQTKSLQDALYLLFEEAADRLELFSGPEGLTDPERWREGRVHQRLRPSELVRITAPPRIFDSRFFRERVDRFLEVAEVLVNVFAHDQLAAARNTKEREKLTKKLVQAMLDDTPPEFAQKLGEFIDLLMGGQVVVRQFPCGAEYADYALVGNLLTRPGYLQEEREALFTKYGSGISDWTVVAQVASIPVDATSEENTLGGNGDTVELQSVQPEGTDEDEALSRSELEQAAGELMEMMERLGLAGGPSHPSIAITPIAIYRDLPVLASLP